MAPPTHAESYLAGLERERAGYEARVQRAELTNDEVGLKIATSRLEQVDREAERVKGGGNVGGPRDTTRSRAPRKAVKRGGASK